VMSAASQTGHFYFAIEFRRSAIRSQSAALGRSSSNLLMATLPELYVNVHWDVSFLKF
jgi:hypothetical protein